MSANYGVGEAISSDTEMPRINPEVLAGLKPIARAITRYAIRSIYPSRKDLIVPFSFLWEGKETEFNVMNYLVKDSEDEFYAMIKAKMDKATVLMRDSAKLQKLVDLEMEAMRLARGADAEIPMMTDVKIYLAVRDRLDYLIERAADLLENAPPLMYRDAVVFDFKDEIKKGIGMLHKLGRIESVPELLTTINEEVSERVFGISDKYRLIEEDQLAYLMGQAEESLK